MIQHRYYAPCPALEPYIQCFHFLENTNDAQLSSPQRVTPDGCFESNFNLADAVMRSGPEQATALDACYTVGRSSLPYFVQRTGTARVLSVRFHPWGLRRFTSVPPSLVADTAVASGELFGKGIDELHDRLHDMAGIPRMIAALEEFFLARLTVFVPDDMVMDAAHAIANSGGDLSTGELRHRFGLSERRVQQRFTVAIGTTPKPFARLVRFQRSLKLMMHGTGSQDAAFECGYYDQAHFIREFSHFAGISPLRYMKEAHPLNDAMLLGA